MEKNRARMAVRYTPPISRPSGGLNVVNGQVILKEFQEGPEVIQVDNKFLKVKVMREGSYHLGRHGEMHMDVPELKHKNQCLICSYDRQHKPDEQIHVATTDGGRRVYDDQFVPKVVQPDRDDSLMTPYIIGHTFHSFHHNYVAIFAIANVKAPFRFVHRIMLSTFIPSFLRICPYGLDMRKAVFPMKLPQYEPEEEDYHIFAHYEAGMRREEVIERTKFLNEVFHMTKTDKTPEASAKAYDVMIHEFPCHINKTQS